MELADIPDKYPIPWAYAAGGAYIRPIPTASQIGIQDGAASLTDGYPPLNFQPVASGGVPPFGQDMNGILNQITLWQQWQQAGAPIIYDSAYQSAIGGYPQHSVVWSALYPYTIWMSTTNDNVTNPDAGGAGWVVYTLHDPNTAALIIDGNNTNGAGVKFQGDGIATPWKYIRVKGGVLQVMNNAYNAVILALTDAGALSIPGQATVGVGAIGSGNAAAVTRLGDFTRTGSSGSVWIRNPDGTIDQTIVTTVPAGGGIQTTSVPLLITYPTAILDALISFDGTTPPGSDNPGSISVEKTSTSAVTVATNYDNTATLGVTIRSRGY